MTNRKQQSPRHVRLSTDWHSYSHTHTQTFPLAATTQWWIIMMVMMLQKRYRAFFRIVHWQGFTEKYFLIYFFKATWCFRKNDLEKSNNPLLLINQNCEVSRSTGVISFVLPVVCHPKFFSVDASMDWGGYTGSLVRLNKPSLYSISLETYTKYFLRLW